MLMSISYGRNPILIMRRLVSLSALFITFGFLSGCISQPKTVKASLPLVNPAFTVQDTQTPSSKNEAKAIPELNLQPGNAIALEGKTYRVSEGYTSAMGMLCYRLESSGQSGATETRPVCKHQNHWMLYPVLVISNTL